MIYRSEIDGIRAIAVLSVIFYHTEIIFFGENFFKGGFVGVDIFFVISGYLISKLIFIELHTKKKFNILNFIERRFRRILPVLLVLIIVSIPFAAYYLNIKDSIEFSKSIISNLFFISNIFFYINSIEYGAPASFLKPFLHTWSVSIEIQFYIFISILFFIIFKYFRSSLIPFIIILFILSFFVAMYLSFYKTNFNFYFFPSRVWEFLSGSILVLLETRYKDYKSKQFNKYLPIIGLLLILYSIFFFKVENLSPNFQSIVPVLGISMIIFLIEKNSILYKFLSSKLMTSLGKISYSLYLWHYPIIVFAFINKNSLDQYDKFYLIFISVIFSILTYFSIEKPFRNRTKVPFKFFILFIILCLILILTLIQLFIPINYNFRNFEREATTQAKLILDQSSYHEVWNIKRKEFGNIKFNKINNNKVLIVGNSHATDIFSAFFQNKTLFKDFDFALIQPSLNNLRKANYEVYCFYEYLKNNNTWCHGIDFSENTSMIENFKNAETILLSTFWKPKDFQIIIKLIDTIKKHGKNVIILENKLIFADKMPIRKFISESNRFPNVDELHNLEKDTFKRLYINNGVSDINIKLKNILKDKNVKILSVNDLICNATTLRCKIFTDKNSIIYYDFGHLTPMGAAYLGKLMHENNFQINLRF